MQRESLLKFFRLTPTLRTEYVAQVQRNHVVLQDSLFGFSFVEQKEEYGFSLDWQASREINYDDKLQTVVTIELSNQQTAYFRKVYTFLDLLADLGGLFSSISLLCFFLYNY